MKSKTGETAFSRASHKSVRIGKFILSRNVNVATIDSCFLTPQFYHNELVLDMLLAGINPKGKDSLSYCYFICVIQIRSMLATDEADLGCPRDLKSGNRR